MSNEKCVTPSPTNTPPNSSTLESATPGNGSITLTWSNVSAASSYTVFDSLSNSGYGSVGSTSSTSFTVNGLSAGRTYYFVVTASDSAGESNYSNDLSQMVHTSTPPQPPANLSATPGNAEGALSWNTSDGATGYTITYSNNGTSHAIGTTSTYKYYI